jgi:hypothetical protein
MIRFLFIALLAACGSTEYQNNQIQTQSASSATTINLYPVKPINIHVGCDENGACYDIK